MKRLALVAAVIAVAACSKGENAATDTTTPPAMAPAATPAVSDSMRIADSTRMADSVKRADSTRMADSIAKAKGTKRP